VNPLPAPEDTETIPGTPPMAVGKVQGFRGFSVSQEWEVNPADVMRGIFRNP